MSSASVGVLESIRGLLVEAGVEFRELEHEPTLTSEDSARVRGEPLSVGAKALLLKVDDGFGLFILSADQKLDSSAIKRHLSAKKIRFATPEELWELTRLTPGSVPPFGRPILSFELWADVGVGKSQGRVAFNAGSLTHSLILATADWERVAAPRRFAFAKP